MTLLIRYRISIIDSKFKHQNEQVEMPNEPKKSILSESIEVILRKTEYSNGVKLKGLSYIFSLFAVSVQNYSVFCTILF